METHFLLRHFWSHLTMERLRVSMANYENNAPYGNASSSCHANLVSAVYGVKNEEIRLCRPYKEKWRKRNSLQTGPYKGRMRPDIFTKMWKAYGMAMTLCKDNDLLQGQDGNLIVYAENISIYYIRHFTLCNIWYPFIRICLVVIFVIKRKMQPAICKNALS